MSLRGSIPYNRFSARRNQGCYSGGRMKYFRAMLVGATLLTGASTWAAAQAVMPVQWSWGQRNNNSQAFRDGYRQGRWDAEHRQSANYGNTGSWRSNDDR